MSGPFVFRAAKMRWVVRCWPGFGDNMRVLDWTIKRCEGSVDAVETAIGYELKPEDINVDGLVYEGKQFTTEDVASLLELDIDLWKDEVKELREFYKQFGDKLPAKIKEELDALEARLSK